MLSVAARSGPFAPYLSAAAHAVPGPLKALAPPALRAEKVPLDLRRPLLCRESLSGRAARGGLVASASLNGAGRAGPGVAAGSRARGLPRGRRDGRGAGPGAAASGSGARGAGGSEASGGPAGAQRPRQGRRAPLVLVEPRGARGLAPGPLCGKAEALEGLRAGGG